MLLSILGFVSGLAGPIASIANKITDLQMLKAKAASDVERDKITQQIDEVHDRQAVLVAEAQTRVGAILNSCMRGFLAIPAGVILWKFLIWDKTVGALDGCAGSAGHAERCNIYNTDPLDLNMWWIILAVIGFYFVTTWKSNR